jgi:hypothetical protein
MAGQRSGKDTFKAPSGVQKNTNARKTREAPEVAALRKEIQAGRKRRQEELETIKKDLQAIESQLKNSELTQGERDNLQERHSRFEKYRQDIEEEIKEADSDLMDIDVTEGQGPNPTEGGSLFVELQSADENEMLVKTESVEGSVRHAQGSASASATPTRETIINSVEGDPRNHVGLSEDDVDDELLVGMKKLSTVDYSDGVADAFCRARRTKMLIVRYGPPRAAKYVIQPGVGYNTDGLQDVSDEESRLCAIMVRDGNGVKRPRYGLENIVGIVGVAIMDPPHDSTSSKAPTAYVKIKWKNIAKEHQHLCDKNGNNWNRRTDLKNRTGEEMAFSKLKEAWMKQEERYNNWIRGVEVGTVGRSPTPFPLDEHRRRREESRGPLKVRRGTTIKREETPRASTEATEAPATPRPGTTIKREETPRASTEATEAPTTPRPATVANPLGATSSTETEAQARASSRVTDRQNSFEEGSSGQEDKPASQLTFSEKQYTERMALRMRLEEVREKNLKEYVRLCALIEAEYATYRADMLSRGAIEVV